MFKHCVVCSVDSSFLYWYFFIFRYTSLNFRKPRNIKIRSLHYEMCIFMFIYILNLSWFFIVFFCMIFMYIIYTTRIFPGFIFLLVKVWFPIYFDCIFQISYLLACMISNISLNRISPDFYFFLVWIISNISIYSGSLWRRSRWEQEAL